MRLTAIGPKWGSALDTRGALIHTREYHISCLRPPEESARTRRKKIGASAACPIAARSGSFDIPDLCGARIWAPVARLRAAVHRFSSRMAGPTESEALLVASNNTFGARNATPTGNNQHPAGLDVGSRKSDCRIASTLESNPFTEVAEFVAMMPLAGPQLL